MEKISEKNIAYPKLAISLISGLLIGSLIPYLAFSITSNYGVFLMIAASVTILYYQVKGNGAFKEIKEDHFLFLAGCLFGLIMLIPYIAIINL